MSSSVPGTFPLPSSKYDLSTYSGRVKHCAEVSDPRMLLTSDAQLTEAKSLVSLYRTGKLTTPTPEFWKAKKQLDSTLHPDTGDKVFLPFRMSCCVISNLFVCVGMMTPGLGTAGTVFWQWANQSLNVAINSANANKSHAMSTQQLIINYSAAVTASCGVAVGFNKILPKLKNISVNTRVVLGRLIPFSAVVSAGIVNVFLMRSEELKKGIHVYNPDDMDGEPLGVSKKAAFVAVGETAASRVINATPIMVIPPMLLLALQKNTLKNASFIKQQAVSLGLITLTSFIALPFALGVFPQYETLHKASLEPEIQQKMNEKGISKVVFNRGM
ncbi:tricarboxylate carrier [Hanseniaspora valbyensis NRRL Y-1626]|uniref:Sidoreflexin n=1 Tax=Hanseniaspora valbyensis NRRL Y-1626 TaxID=766949 RepID=A0A1B7TH89_9ASCO|nr:tricarboxylate carrier [Hanseniaspora valbyensis NRRL Y-1626]